MAGSPPKAAAGRRPPKGADADQPGQFIREAHRSTRPHHSPGEHVSRRSTENQGARREVERVSVRDSTATPIVGVSSAAPTPHPASLPRPLPSRPGEEPHGWGPRAPELAGWAAGQGRPAQITDRTGARVPAGSADVACSSTRRAHRLRSCWTHPSRQPPGETVSCWSCPAWRLRARFSPWSPEEMRRSELLDERPQRHGLNRLLPPAGAARVDAACVPSPRSGSAVRALPVAGRRRGRVTIYPGACARPSCSP